MPRANMSHPLNRGLVYWGYDLFNDSTPYGRVIETSGINLATDVVQKNGSRGVDFDGSSSYARSLGTFPDYGVDDYYTLACWVYVKDRSQEGGILGFYDNSSVNDYIRLETHQDTIKLWQRHQTGARGVSNPFVSAGTINENQWYHVIGTVKGDSFRQIFLDGELIATDTTTKSTVQYHDSIGIGRSEDSTPSQYFEGVACDFRMHHGLAYNESQARQLYLASINGYPGLIQRSRILQIQGTGTSEPTAYTLACDAASYVYTGQDADLLYGLVVDGEAGSYALTGQDADLLYAHVLDGDAGAYTLTGQDATLTYLSGSTCTAWTDPGSGADDMALILGSVSWTNAGNITASDTTYATATLGDGDTTNGLYASNFGFSIPTGSTIDGIEVQIKGYDSATTTNTQTAFISLVDESTILTGTSKSSTTDYPDTDGGYFLSFGGSADVWGATLTPAIINDADFGVVFDAGKESGGGSDPVVSVDSVQMKVCYTPPSTIDADAGSYTVTGQDADLLYDRLLSATTAGTYSLTGQDADLVYAITLDGDAGSYALTGQDADLIYDHVIDADAGSYSVTGQSATLNYAGNVSLTADAGSYTVTGQDADLIYGFLIEGDAGSYAVTGQDVDLLYSRHLDGDAGSYLLNGQDATLTYSGQTASILAAATTMWMIFDDYINEELYYRQQPIRGYAITLHDKSTLDLVTSGSVTVYIVKDGGVQTTIADTPVHKGNGTWSFDLSETEMDARNISILITHSNAWPRQFNIRTVG